MAIRIQPTPTIKGKQAIAFLQKMKKRKGLNKGDKILYKEIKKLKKAKKC